MPPGRPQPRGHRVSVSPEMVVQERIRQSLLPADWPAPASVHAFTTLRGPAGVSAAPFDSLNLGLRSGDEPEAVRENRRALTIHAGLPSPAWWLQQVHGTDVVHLEHARTDDHEPQADAAVTRRPGVVLAILTADCLPVLLCHRDGEVIGAAHAGWRGLVAGVLERTVAAMEAEPSQIMAWLGPAAGPQAYEVGEEVRAAFVDTDPATAVAFVATRPGHWLCDLYALARRRLARAGVTCVSGGGLCTISDPQRFHSFRRDGRCGRMASLIFIEPNTVRA